MSDADHVFSKLCHEAVLACGADIPAIERYVAERIEMMDPREQDRIRSDLERMLKFRAPFPTKRAH